MKAVLHDDAREVTTTIWGYVAKKFVKRSSCDLCPQTLTSQEIDLENDSYLKLLHVVDCLYHQNSSLILFVVALLF